MAPQHRRAQRGQRRGDSRACRSSATVACASSAARAASGLLLTPRRRPHPLTADGSFQCPQRALELVVRGRDLAQLSPPRPPAATLDLPQQRRQLRDYRRPPQAGSLVAARPPRADAPRAALPRPAPLAWRAVTPARAISCSSCPGARPRPAPRLGRAWAASSRASRPAPHLLGVVLRAQQRLASPAERGERVSAAARGHPRRRPAAPARGARRRRTSRARLACGPAGPRARRGAPDPGAARRPRPGWARTSSGTTSVACPASISAACQRSPHSRSASRARCTSTSASASAAVARR